MPRRFIRGRTDRYHGRACRALRAAVFAQYGTTCHLCGRPGANEVDHLIPRSQRPDLATALENCRPAHRQCNNDRRNAPLSAMYATEGW